MFMCRPTSKANGEDANAAVGVVEFPDVNQSA
jgi:hypothetical protein